MRNNEGVAPVGAPPGVSVLLVVKNERRNLERSFDVIAGQQYGGPVEFVCIDSGSTDGTLEFLQERRVTAHVIPPDEFHHARTRNLAAGMARHAILVLLSGDAIPTDDRWLANLVAPFDDPAVGAVYGKQIPPPGTGAVRAHGLAYLYPDAQETRVLPADGTVELRLIRFSNANCAVRAELWRKYKFPDTSLVAEDHYICYRTLKDGLKVVYEPKAAVIHGHERSIWGEFQFAVDNAISLKRMGILDDPNIGSEIKYGMDRIRSDLGYFAGKGMYACALRSLAVSAVKWVGVQFGKREKRMPDWFLRAISENMK